MYICKYIHVSIYIYTYIHNILLYHIVLLEEGELLRGRLGGEERDERGDLLLQEAGVGVALRYVCIHMYIYIYICICVYMLFMHL